MVHESSFTPYFLGLKMNRSIIMHTYNIQCSGEAEFTTDISTMNGELAAAIVLTSQVSHNYYTIIIITHVCIYTVLHSSKLGMIIY